LGFFCMILVRPPVAQAAHGGVVHLLQETVTGVSVSGTKEPNEVACQ